MLAGDVVEDRFVIERLAGSGGMGQVYRAQDRETGQPVAVKVLYGERDGNLSRFEREARILSSITHPHVVRYLTHGVHSTGDPYLVMEWLEGCDLSARIEQGIVNIAATIEVASGAAEALGSLHERGIVHRDLKPSNLFLVEYQTDRVKLLDFGIALSNAASKLTGTGILLGTAPYMSPEQATGAVSVDARADVFSLGCVMYECLTGEKAFDGVHVMAILTKILFHDPPRLGEKRPDLPFDLCSLVDRMLAKAPAARPADGKAVAETLRQLGKSPTTATDETTELVTTTSLTQSEQRALALIFIGAPQGVVDDERLANEAAKHHGRFERFLDGSAVVMLSRTSIATDLAVQAARCALALKREAPSRRIALTIGRNEEDGPIHLNRVIDRVARLLDTDNNDPASNDYATLDDTTVGLLDARFEVIARGDIFSLVSEREAVEVRTLLGKPTPCVGRDRELRQIEDAYCECVDEAQARVILLTGPAGTGKSRIGREIVQRLRAHENPPSIWIARGELLGAGSALSLLAKLVRGVCGIRTDESPDARRNKLRERLAEHVSARHRQQCTEFLGEVIGAAFPDANSLQLRAARQDPQLMSDQIRTAFIEFLRAEVEKSPVCLLLEDLHWGDGASVRILDNALGELAETPLFLLALGRPEVDEVFPRLWADRGLETKRLPQLSKKAAEQLVKHVLGDGTDANTIERIVRLSEGNAFYLEELIRATATGKGDELPETVVAMVQSRLLDLSDIQRRILRAASIFGETFWAGGIAALIGHSTGVTNWQSALPSLVENELFTKKTDSRFLGEHEYTFRHALLREGAYAMLTENDSKLGHRLAGQWLEQHGETDALVLAGHYQKGGEGGKAARFFLRVAEIATAGGDSDIAVARATQALDCGPTESVRIELLGVICEACGWQIQSAIRARPFAEELLGRVVPGSKWWAQAFFALTSAMLLQNEPKNLLALVDQAFAVTPVEDAVAPFVFYAGVTSLHLDLMGETQRADALVERLRAISEQYQTDPWVVANFSNRFCVRILTSGRGNPWNALEHALRSLQLLEEIRHRRLHAISHIMHGVSEWCLGRFQTALDILNNPLLPDREVAHAGFLRRFALAWIHADSGRLLVARGIAEQFIESSGSLPVILARGRWLFAEILRRQGDFENADRVMQQALSSISVFDQSGMYSTLAALRLDQGRIAEAVDAATQGMAIYETIRACSYVRAGFLRLVHAQSLYAAQRYGESKQAIEKAKSWLLEMAEEIPDLAYRTSYLNDVPEHRKILELAKTWV